ncbi:hypothetical protein QFC20_001978 [Naganishia adeliensis]|uniref:Uncharacterized protein n=1 Tax=Naganishia adeliensis TaxID=92952 RepID=A0ACC2WNR6_9TREE|nr:hypothetical protein QFC20_001978 [Naganishia adeliensis]
MFKSSSNLVKQASQRVAVRLAPSAQPSRLLSTSTTRLADHEEGPVETRQSRMEKLLLEIPPEYNIPGLSQRTPRDNKTQSTRQPQRRPQNASQPYSRPPRQVQSPTEAYSLLQNIGLPQQDKPRRSFDSSKRQNEDGRERRPRTERGERPERSAQGVPRPDKDGSRSYKVRENRQPRQNNREGGGARAETSRGANKERTPRRDAERPTSSGLPTLPRRQEPKPEVQRAAPTVAELFGDSSMLGGQSSVVNEVFESLEATQEAPASKNVPKASNLDLLPPSPIVPHSLTPSAPRKQINEFAVLQADYVLSRNSNVTLDQRGQAIGVVKQRLGA